MIIFLCHSPAVCVWVNPGPNIPCQPSFLFLSHRWAGVRGRGREGGDSFCHPGPMSVVCAGGGGWGGRIKEKQRRGNIFIFFLCCHSYIHSASSPASFSGPCLSHSISIIPLPQRLRHSHLPASENHSQSCTASHSHSASSPDLSPTPTGWQLAQLPGGFRVTPASETHSQSSPCLTQSLSITPCLTHSIQVTPASETH